MELSVLLHRALEARVGRLLEVTGTPGWSVDPGTLHEARVASRRVRAVLDLVDPSAYPGHRGQVRRLKRLTGILGALRELDVHALLLEGLGTRELRTGALAALEHAAERLDRRRRQARVRLEARLARLAPTRVAELLAVRSLPAPGPGLALAEAVWECLRPDCTAILEALPPLLDQEDPEGLHALRIRLKRARYALEVLAPAFAVPQDARLEQLRSLQTALGEHHDRAALEGWLWRLQAGLAERQRPVLAAGTLEVIGLLSEDRRERFGRFRALAPAFLAQAFLPAFRADLDGPAALRNPAP